MVKVWNNTKHKDLVIRYKENRVFWSANYPCFYWRVMRCWRTKEKAIIRLHPVKKPNQIKSEVLEHGRVCTNCNIFKTWDLYCKSVWWVAWHTNNCKECRNKYKREFRAKTDYAKDREYKKKKRTLHIGDKIKLKDVTKVWDTYIHPVREVVKYEYKKWYTLYSQEHKVYRSLDTGDNKANKRNSVWFYHVI